MESIWHTTALVFHLIAAVGIVILVLLQHGKGADVGAAFGSGSAGSLFGSAGASNFLSKTTAGLAAVFFVTSLALTFFSTPSKSGGVTQQLEVPGAVKPGADKTPAAPAPSAPAPAGTSPASPEIPK
jgi:preprotein translocase subunit SecG